MASAPRVVVLTRPSEYEQLVARHGTVGQAKFFLDSRGQSIEALHDIHEAQLDAVRRTTTAIPTAWRRTQVSRDDLSRFLFEDDDLIVVVGQDGLVANVAKYLSGQPVIGVNPAPNLNSGVLVPHSKHAIGDLIAAVGRGRYTTQARTMVEVVVDGGHSLRALNEVFIGHRTHQSARYSVCVDGCPEERHSSSGLIVSTGTGCTGWARSIGRQRDLAFDLVGPSDPRLVYFAREAFPSPLTGCSLTEALVDDRVCVVSHMNEGGVIFGDGIEDDRIAFGWGRRAEVRRAPVALNLVQG